MKHRLTIDEIIRTFNTARANGLLADQDAAVFYDLDFFTERVAAVHSSFPPSALHAVALKANPLLALARIAASMSLGAEVASVPELTIARSAGFPPERIVFDSPVKSRNDLVEACLHRVLLNVDSFDELDRLTAIRATAPPLHAVGIRINPQVGQGQIAMTGVAGTISKFGVPLQDSRDRLIKAFQTIPWLSGLHVHIGSQGCPLELLVEGVAAVWRLARDIQDATGRSDRLNFFDIGGGLPVAYRDSDDPPDVSGYATALRSACPDLFAGNVRLVTEFGRMLHAPCGWAVSRIEYVKRFAQTSILMTHLGADMFLRKCYHPHTWHHDLLIVDRAGEPRSTGQCRTMVAGPLCFSGDVLEEEVLLPEAREGDYLIIRDVGAYTFSMWSRYNSRQFPRVVGYRQQGCHFEVLKEREEPGAVVAFWT